MKDRIIISREVPQYKGNFHTHTERSWDSTAPLGELLQEYYDKGYRFCAITDHEKYWDSAEFDREDFLTLSGAESAFILNEDPLRWILSDERCKTLHLNLLHDVTAGENGFIHDQVLKRPCDYGLDSWNQYIAYCRERSQMVIINHPSWSRLDPEIMLGIHGAFAFEIWNSASVLGAGCSTDEDIWDYCLSRGKRLWALTGDDAHSYGPERCICGGAFTMLCAEDFSKEALITAIKNGQFYPSTGPKIYDMRIVDNVLYMDFDPAVTVRIVSRDQRARAFTPVKGETITHLEWEITKPYKYFRVEIFAPDGTKAWSQPVFPNPWDREDVALRECRHTPIPADQEGLQ